MTKLTDMCATARRTAARDHRTKAVVLKTQMDKLTGFTPAFLRLKAKEVFHTAQAKLWDAAAQQAEQAGFVRLT